jgi:hypothetical protein
MQTIIPDSPSGDGFSRLCSHCNQDFSPKNRNKKYCCSTCKSRAKEIRRLAAGRFYPKTGNEYEHRYIYRMIFGPESLQDYEVHHLFGMSNTPFNLLALPKSVHTTLHHMLRKGEDVTEILAPYFAKRDECFRQQSNLKKNHHSPYRNQSKTRKSKNVKKGRSS